MEGGNGANRGIVPRAVDHIFAEAARLEQRGWTFTINASFLEIYNEELRCVIWQHCTKVDD